MKAALVTCDLGEWGRWVAVYEGPLGVRTIGGVVVPGPAAHQHAQRMAERVLAVEVEWVDFESTPRPVQRAAMGAMDRLVLRLLDRGAYRLALVERDGPRCVWCGEVTEVVSSPKNGRDATIEHMLPKKWGGLFVPRNLAISCSDCNNRRGSSLGPPAPKEIPCPTSC